LTKELSKDNSQHFFSWFLYQIENQKVDRSSKEAGQSRPDATIELLSARYSKQIGSGRVDAVYSPGIRQRGQISGLRWMILRLERVYLDAILLCKANQNPRTKISKQILIYSSRSWKAFGEDSLELQVPIHINS